MEKSLKASRILELDFVRVLAMFWVVTYHFGIDYSRTSETVSRPLVNFFYDTPNFDFGNVAVTMFLLLSGALLYGKYGRTPAENLGSFYKKRALSIYPPFWIANLFVVVALARHWLSDGTPFFAGNPLKLLLTVVGFDGYTRLYGLENYYFCGEWFVGAIVLLYLLFPVLSWAYRKGKVALYGVLGIAYVLQMVFLDDGRWIISALPFTLLLKFALGFLLMDALSKLRSLPVGLGALAVFLGLCLIDIPVSTCKNDFFGTVAGISVFLWVLNFGGLLTKVPLLGKTVLKLAPLTYCVFLIQHVTILWLQILFVKVLGRPALEFSPALCMGLFVVTFMVALVVACGLKFVSDKTVKLVKRKFLS